MSGNDETQSPVRADEDEEYMALHAIANRLGIEEEDLLQRSDLAGLSDDDLIAAFNEVKHEISDDAYYSRHGFGAPDYISYDEHAMRIYRANTYGDELTDRLGGKAWLDDAGRRYEAAYPDDTEAAHDIHPQAYSEWYWLEPPDPAYLDPRPWADRISEATSRAGRELTDKEYAEYARWRLTRLYAEAVHRGALSERVTIPDGRSATVQQAIILAAPQEEFGPESAGNGTS